MKVTKKGAVYQLAFMPRWFPVNCYLVEEERELTLVDAALPFHAQAIAATAAAIGKPIAHIVLTHAHSDHVGALDRLKALFPAAVVHISARDARLLAGDRSLLPGEPSEPIRGGVPKRVKTKPDALLADGGRVGSLAAIDCPGHTPGSMAFLDTRSGSLLAGDAFQTRGGLAVSGKLQPAFPFPAMATWSRRAALESAKKLLSLRPSLLAVGHGRMLDDPVPAMERAIRSAERAFAGGEPGKG